MSLQRTLGPYEMLTTTSGSVPLYVIPFDEQGRCEGPKTLNHLLKTSKSRQFTDIHIFSHGWNNTFEDALSLYRRFFNGYLALRDNLGLNDSDHYRSLLVGIVWPSISLVLPWEIGPTIAAQSMTDDETSSIDLMVLREVATQLPVEDVERFYELIDREDKLDDTEALKLAQILQPIYEKADDSMEVGDEASTIDSSELMILWKKLLGADKGFDDTGEGGFARDDNPVTREADAPAAAGLLEWLDPRQPLRWATVLIMKDRAGRVGAHGVGPMLKELLSSPARVHLMGHSYGCKVVLSSLCYPTHPRRVTSLLLLQPAISCLCFAENVDGNGYPGGYRDALERVEQPIVSTFSKLDMPLTKFFHLAVRRESDLGEQDIAGAPPSKFAALGGYGPVGINEGESRTLMMLDTSANYSISESGIKIYGLDGSDNKINGHGDVANPFTQWALINLVSGSELK